MQRVWRSADKAGKGRVQIKFNANQSVDERRADLYVTVSGKDKMLVASFITPDNIELGVEGVKAIFDYIVTTAAELFGPTTGG